jgi:hypothetical protein
MLNRLARRVREGNFGGTSDRLDLVIEDAPHFYPESKASFEALFPSTAC